DQDQPAAMQSLLLLLVAVVGVVAGPDPSGPASASTVPGWGIALLVLVCILLVLSIIIFILLILCSCCRSRRGNLDLFSLQDSYHPMTEYPTYHTHGRYMAPVTKPNPYSEVSGNGSRALSYTNPALSSENL
uniref:Mucin 1, cell surface associated n=1 Tax=Crocodylus porosus TaxID=8502 RepID=A0A7M4E3G6_CROPO